MACSFALESPSADGVRYNSRESGAGGPEVVVDLVGGALPACGDGRVNQASEQCDGADSAACPGVCLADCTCPTAAAAAVVEADTTVSSAQPTAILGGEPVLSVDAGPSVKRTFFRIRVSGVGSRRVASARLQLQVANLLNAESVLGGTIHAITACGWDEHVLTWNSQPSIDGPVLAGTGPVTQGQRVEFDVTPAITADGVYCFALDSSSEDAAHYNSREAGAGRPAMAVLVQ